MQWFKSSYSGRDSDCVECVGAVWSKSSYSGRDSNCVEYAALPTTIALRDSKHPEAGHLTLPLAEWSAFITAAKSGEL
ncbi:DUF397 domain-containing protein [Marinitenerispora sediminis]|nr:DUF397 domain-containing protein [Marinitenerispora sediminis]